MSCMLFNRHEPTDDKMLNTDNIALQSFVNYLSICVSELLDQLKKSNGKPEVLPLKLFFL